MRWTGQGGKKERKIERKKEKINKKERKKEKIRKICFISF